MVLILSTCLGRCLLSSYAYQNSFLHYSTVVLSVPLLRASCRPVYLWTCRIPAAARIDFFERWRQIAPHPQLPARMRHTSGGPQPHGHPPSPAEQTSLRGNRRATSALRNALHSVVLGERVDHAESPTLSYAPLMGVSGRCPVKAPLTSRPCHCRRQKLLDDLEYRSSSFARRVITAEQQHTVQ